MINEVTDMQAYPRIVFMGTPEFAVSSLEALVKAGFNVVAVITAPDKPAGRGMHLQQSAVKKYAVHQNIPVLQPEKLKNPAFIETLKNYHADLQVVVAFRMLPEVVWNMPPLGTLNVHGSLLPHYRGAAPINWAIINGETETGVTTFKLQHAIDTGDILLSTKISIGINETAGELHDRMKDAGAQTLVKTLQGMLDGSLIPFPQPNFQDGSEPKHAPKIFTETCKINACSTVSSVYNLIRGLSPFPGAFISFDGKVIKVFRAAPSRDIPKEIKPGSWYSDGKSRLSLCLSDGWIDLLEIQPEGKKRMQVTDFLRGYRPGEQSAIK
jgi:methionyl-tRNA formyltransferase